MGGGGFSMEPENRLLDDLVLDLARAERGRERPRVCFLATASGDSPAYIASFYAAFARRAEASHLALFVRTDGWVLLGYETWPGTPRGLDLYTRPPSTRRDAA